MPYQINRYNRDPLTTVQDGNTDSNTTSLTFVGKNFAGYGGLQNENFLYLLENFANSSPPSNPSKGQIWYDSGNRKLRFYDTTYTGGSPEPATYAKWRNVGAEIGSVQPSGLTVGDFWFDTDTKQLKVYVGGTTPFRLIGPQAVNTFAQTSLESVTVKDNTNDHNLWPVIKGVIDGSAVFVISSNEFNLNSDESLYTSGDFDFISQGITLANSKTGSTIGSYRFWGTASDSKKLDGSLASAYVMKTDATFNNLATFSNDGLTINNILKMSIDSSEATIQNTSSKGLSFKVKDTTTLNPLKIDGYDVIPGATITYNLGTVTNRWNNFYTKNANIETLTVSGTVTATAQNADKLKFGTGNYVSATDTWSAGNGNTIVARDTNGDFTAHVITATVTQARYADLAEKYESDAVYEPGTVVVFGGEKEITITDLKEDARVAGVISTNPAYLMNVESEGLAVALRGKVPCKVVGQVYKGDILVTSSTPGYAMAGNTASLPATLIGKSLENKADDDFGTIMIVVT